MFFEKFNEWSGIVCVEVAADVFSQSQCIDPCEEMYYVETKHAAEHIAPNQHLEDEHPGCDLLSFIRETGR